jgi:hypothetical protein
MITTKTQIKPKHTYLYAYIPIYFYPVKPVNPVKKQNEPKFSLFILLLPFPFYLFTFLPNEPKFHFLIAKPQAI